MKSTHFVIYHIQGANEGLNLDPNKLAFKGSHDDALAYFTKYHRKAREMAKNGLATKLKDGWTMDGAMWTEFVSGGKKTTFYFADRAQAANLLI
ncbi:MAG: hypothetical protein NC548_53125 [Lachnospiraceae bacterium]|nr:hypothetical protein [Lachnospiraceae bacterium]